MQMCMVHATDMYLQTIHLLVGKLSAAHAYEKYHSNFSLPLPHPLKLFKSTKFNEKNKFHMKRSEYMVYRKAGERLEVKKFHKHWQLH